ncbi:hypothetical protein AB0I81_34040 [Nonomuraea sp. NPDC050404]|uniref:hypothetical protein n=1 Tax=Nonomuraea sp. NPDC050404 TaxID=3155783 RepID=UPI0033FD0D56
MTRTVRDLRELFDDMSADAPADRPRRIDELDRRIRHDSRRRSTTLALAGVAALTAVTVLIPTVLLPRAPEKPQETMATPELPPRFTAKDGAEYRRLVTTTLKTKTKGEKKKSVTIPVSGKPLDVAGLCDAATGLTERPMVLVNGKPNHRGFSDCTGKADLISLNVPKGAKEATVTFDTTAWGCGRKKGEPCPSIPIMKPADWALAIYEWTPPARPVEPERFKALPREREGMKVAGDASGVWPRQKSFKLTVTSRGGKLGINHVCTGELAERLLIRYRISGDRPTYTSRCYPLDGSTDPALGRWVLTEVKVPKGKKITIRGTMMMQGGHPNRPVRWSAAVYVLP